MGQGMDCKRLRWWQVAIGLLILAPVLLSANAVAGAVDCSPPPGTLVYKLFNDAEPVGEARIDIIKNGTETRIRTEVDVEVSILIFSGLAYRHNSEEVWRDGVFDRFRGKTDNAGKLYDISITATPTGVRLNRNGRIHEITAPLMTWAIWCEAALGQPQILDPLKGKLKPFSATFRGVETLTIGGRKISSRRFHVVRKGRPGDLWYGPDGIVVKAAFPSRIGTTGTAILSSLK